MSYQLLVSDVLFYQRFLKSNGFYKKELDGEWGSGTDAADDAFLSESEKIAEQYGRFDKRSESNIITLTPKSQIAARRFLDIMKNNGKDVRIISGTRTYAEQDALYRKGRNGNRENKVTNAKGGQSNHNFGIAWDIGLFEDGKYITDIKKYKQLSPLVIPHISELEWGGDWKSFPDFPHYQLKTSVKEVSLIRLNFESGKSYV